MGVCRAALANHLAIRIVYIVGLKPRLLAFETKEREMRWWAEIGSEERGGSWLVGGKAMKLVAKLVSHHRPCIKRFGGTLRAF